MNDSRPVYPPPQAMVGVVAAVEAAFEELELHQRQRLLKMSRDLVAQATLDDLLDPHSHPALIRDPTFNYEDGYLAGLMAARISLRRKVLNPLAAGEAPEPQLPPPGPPPATSAE